MIRETIVLFDPQAAIRLFGAGATKLGKQMDLYIQSPKIDRDMRKHTILTYHLQNIDRVCETHSEKDLQVMMAIGINVYLLHSRKEE